jgi:hypothetical protein
MASGHLNPEQLLAYLDKRLPTEAARQAWLHLQFCPRCQAQLAAEEKLRAELKVELGVLGRRRSPDLRQLLPTILRESRRPMPPLSRWTLGLIGVVVAFTLLPLIPLFKAPMVRANDNPLLNVPIITQTFVPPESERKTPDPYRPISSVNLLPNAFNMEYASPAPLPQATAAASLQPKRKN